MPNDLTDSDRLELTGLCGALADGCLNAQQSKRLNDLLRHSEEARLFYLRHSSLSASLYAYSAELQSDAPTAPHAPNARISKLLWWSAMAALVLIAGIVLWPSNVKPPSDHESSTVAMMTGTKDCEWSGKNVSPGSTLTAGQKLELTKGTAEITFDSGAQVTLDGPTCLVVSSAWDASLESGSLKASVPTEAAGFRVNNPSVEVVDQGAEFSIIADASSAEVLVLKGTVEAAPHNAVQSVMLRSQESRRFDVQGITEVRDRDRKFAKLAKVLTLDRNPSVGGYTHWTFDSSEGSILAAEVKGRKKPGSRTRMVTNQQATAIATLTDGRWGKGLSFDGRLSAKASVSGLSVPDEARTLAFWVNVPATTPLVGGVGTMLGWGEKSRRHDNPHVSIGWNKRPVSGAVGALRTELGQDVALGSTNLRDGKWHHIAIVFRPRSDGHLQAKQYVDGRLEGMASTSIRKGTGSDLLWLGRAPGDRPKEAMFIGTLDELFVVDRPLSPAEIVRLMRDNQPPEIVVAGN